MGSTIGDLLRQGQEVLVQVVKDQLGTKGARLTTHITLPGRFLVYLPTVHQHGVSRRITDPDERARLKALVEEFSSPGGWIVRTAGENQGADELATDRDELLRLWQRVQHASERGRPPSLIHHELSPLLRTVRDMFTDSIQEAWIDDEDGFEEILRFLEQTDPALVPRVKLFRRPTDLMTAFGIDRELEKALRPKVWLKSGGYLVVNQTEALVAIDVNTGKFVGSTSLEDTVFRNNLEAVREIVRQLRLRDLGGIVVIDFIDMEDPEHREAVYVALANELGSDPARTQLLPMSDIGLVQLTRKRARPSLDRTLSRECPYCHGSGRIKALATICLEIRRELLSAAEGGDGEQVSLVVHPDVSHYLQGPFRDLMRELEDDHKIQIILQENPLYHQEQFEIKG
jgi:ribonuclease G